MGERKLFVPAFPMLAAQVPNEPLDQTAGRVVELIRKTDRALATASIWGLNRLAPLLTAIGMVLTALRLPLSEADDFLDQPRAWQGRLKEAVKSCPETWPAVTYLENFFLPLNDRERTERTDVLRNKLSLLRFNQVARTMFSAPEPLFSWDEVT